MNKRERQLTSLLGLTPTPEEIFATIFELDNQVDSISSTIESIRKIKAGEKGEPGRPGEKGERGEAGKPGPQGVPGQKGLMGKTGKQGKAGIRGIPGEPGRPGLNGEPGQPGEKGIQGEKGDIPKHEWFGTKLRFENPDKTWGKWVDLGSKDNLGGQMFGATFDLPAVVSAITTQTGTISDLNGLDTVKKINVVFSLIINGQGQHVGGDFTFSNKRITYNSALDSSFTGVNYTLVYL